MESTENAFGIKINEQVITSEQMMLIILMSSL